MKTNRLSVRVFKEDKMNELVVIEKIDKKLQERRDPVQFPIAQAHRKELRELRDSNIGNIRQQLKVIKQLKCEEYQKKYSSKIKKDIEEKSKVCDVLNDDWKKRLEQIDKIILDRKKFEEKYDMSMLDLSNGYIRICELMSIQSSSDYRRSFSLDISKKSDEIASKEFDKIFKAKFDAIEQKIDQISKMYEEAISFGDLEQVKAIYYQLKKSDAFFKKVSELEI